MRLRHFFGIIAVIVLLIGSGCSMDYRSKDDGGGGSSSNDPDYTKLSKIQYIRSEDIDVRAELITDKDGDNVLKISHEEQEYMYYRFTKRGNDTSDEADSSGTNAAILADDSATLTLKDSLIFASGDHAHGVFSLAEGTSLVVSECVVSVKGANSSGVMTSNSGTAELHHITAETFGDSSPVLRVYDRGGAITAERGKFSSYGTNSPVILANGSVSVSSAKLEASSSQAVLINGKNSVTLENCDVVSDSDSQPAVMLYVSGNGNPLSSTGEFTMNGGTLSCAGEAFYVTNAAANITLNNVDITAGDEESSTFLRAEASEFGTSGVNGGRINLSATNQNIDGDIYLDGASDLNMHLTEDSYFTGSINSSGNDARVYVEINDSKWVLTGDSYVDELTCEENSITLGGHTLYVAGKAYEAGTSSSGTEIDFASDRTKPDSGNDSGDDSGEDNGDNNGDNGGDDNGEDNNGDDNNGTETPEVEITRLSFDATHNATGTVNGVSYRVYKDISYVRKPVSGDHQKLNIYIPEPYFSSRPVNGYNAWTAPIFIPNNSSGYMAASIVEPTDTNPAGLAISRGLVVVSPALRGRNVNNGYAPAAIVDYKAVIRYIRANASRFPAGDTDKIIVSGVDSGGALAAILGTSGNTTDYDYWLEDLGAAEAGDKIFAAVSYCPVTDLENADGAYEFIFGGEKYGGDSVNIRTDFQSYFNSLGLKSGDIELEIYEDDYEYEEGQSFRRYLNGLYAQAAQNALDSGSVISADWLTVSGNTVISADLMKYADSFTVRQKTVPAFDKFDLSSPENNEFGYMHFTIYSAEHSTAGGEFASQEILSAMNPLEFVDYADTCKYWRIRHGVNDRDISPATPAVLALRLKNAGFTVDYSEIWGRGHEGYYDTTELFDWIDSICKE